MTAAAPPSAAMWTRMRPFHDAVLRHPFVRGLTDGTLPVDAFSRYVIQDALYLRDYGRALALCAARAGDTATLRMFCLHAAEAIDAERALHTHLMAELGIDPAAAESAEPSPTCRAYTSFLLGACTLGERHEAFAAVLPCYWIYREVGRALMEQGSPDARYAAWIATYGGDEFSEAADGAIAACDSALADLGASELERAHGNAVISSRYEWMFWDSAWRDERWPDV